MKLVALSLLLILTGCANYNTWTRTDKILGVMSVTAGMADAYTTDRVLNHPGFEETNPFLGEHPSDAHLYGYFTASHLVILWVADRFPKIRKLLLGTTAVTGGAAAVHNRNLYHE